MLSVDTARERGEPHIDPEHERGAGLLDRRRAHAVDRRGLQERRGRRAGSGWRWGLTAEIRGEKCRSEEQKLFHASHLAMRKRTTICHTLSTTMMLHGLQTPSRN